MTTTEPPDSQCDIRRIHGVAFDGDTGTVMFTLETKRAQVGGAYDTPDPVVQSMFAPAVVFGRVPETWHRFVVRIESDNGNEAEVRLTETQLRAMLRAVRAAFLKQ